MLANEEELHDDALAQAVADKLGTIQLIANAEKPTDDESVGLKLK